MALRYLAAIVIAAILSLPALACWNRAAEPVNGRLDPQLRRVVSQQPDSVVGLLIRTTAHPTRAQLAELADLGIAVGSVVDTIVTGRAPARVAVRLVALDFVEYVQLAATLRPTGG